MPIIQFRQTIASNDAVRPFDLTDRGLLLGDGVFDTSLVKDGRMILRERHIGRLVEACDVFGHEVAKTEIEALAKDAVPEDATGALRLTVTRGPGGRGLAETSASNPTLMASFTPMPLMYPSPPLCLGVSTIQRNPTAPSALYKTLSYGDAVMGQRQAQRNGYDDALFLTSGGHITCSSIANIWAWSGSTLVTPPRSDGVVVGVVRGWLLENAIRYGFEVSERSLRLDDIAHADGVFLTNSLRLVVPVRAIDEMEFSPDLPSELESLISELLSS